MDNFFTVLKTVARVFRYRFFLFAGLFPFFIGQALAFSFLNNLSFVRFSLGLFAIVLVLIGVELFNEYFDASRGGDRIFSQEEIKIPHYFLPLGLFLFFLAFLVGLYFTFSAGAWIMVFAVLGFVGAYFYVGEPLKFAYRGWGEIVIALCYGPFMVLGSFYLQAESFNIKVLFSSLLFAVSLFSLAVLNEIPDYYQDKLVGKRNLVVRLGRKRGVILFSFSCFLLFLMIIFGLVFNLVPLSCIFILLTLPFLMKGIKKILTDPDNPENYRYAVNIKIFNYLFLFFLLTLGYLS